VLATKMAQLYVAKSNRKIGFARGEIKYFHRDAQPFAPVKNEMKLLKNYSTTA
jgi:hypothetical protein